MASHTTLNCLKEFHDLTFRLLSSFREGRSSSWIIDHDAHYQAHIPDHDMWRSGLILFVDSQELWRNYQVLSPACPLFLQIEFESIINPSYALFIWKLLQENRVLINELLAAHLRVLEDRLDIKRISELASLDSAVVMSWEIQRAFSFHYYL